MKKSVVLEFLVIYDETQLLLDNFLKSNWVTESLGKNIKTTTKYWSWGCGRGLRLWIGENRVIIIQCLLPPNPGPSISTPRHPCIVKFCCGSFHQRVCFHIRPGKSEAINGVYFPLESKILVEDTVQRTSTYLKEFEQCNLKYRAFGRKQICPVGHHCWNHQRPTMMPIH